MTQSAAIGIVHNTEDLVDNNLLHELRPDARIEFIEDVHQQQAAVMLDILRRSDVMANLAAWGGGTALGDDTYGRVTVSAAVGVISVVGWSLTDYARGGSAVESVQYNFRKPADTEADESQVLVLRFVAHRDHR